MDDSKFENPDYFEVWDMRDYHFNDLMRSYACGKDVQYNMCNLAPDKDCYDLHGDTGAGTAYDSKIVQGDYMTTLKMRPYSAADAGAVTIFEDQYCSGRMGRLFASVTPGEK